MEIVQSVADAFLQRTATQRFKTGVRIFAKDMGAGVMDQLLDRLIKRSLEISKIQGYKEPEFEGIETHLNDYGQRLSVSISIQAKKDPNATMLYAVAERYEKLIKDSLIQRDLLIAIIDSSRTIVSARKRLKKLRGTK